MKKTNKIKEIDSIVLEIKKLAHALSERWSDILSTNKDIPQELLADLHDAWNALENANDLLSNNEQY